jgi:hypothetical protein
MTVAMAFLACLCLLMGLLVLVPSLRASILAPAADTLTATVGYSEAVIEMLK